jgi:hypothetical protein
MVVVPPAIPVRIPVVASIVPLAGVRLDHDPPLAELVSVVVCPAHTFSVPPIAPGTAFTVTMIVELQLPTV